MGKVFRLHRGGIEGSGWFNVQPLGTGDVNNINDPAGGTSAFDITSIPSPFARIDLVKTAFKYVNGSGNLDGNTIYHKLVSDALDVAELFFKIDEIKGAEIVSWSKVEDLQNLVRSTNPKHKLLGETLELFLKQDAEAYAFDKLNRLFILKIRGQIVGSTSPSTLFMSCSNDLDWVEAVFNNDRMFDNEYCPLFKRDASFQKYFHYLVKNHPFRQYFSEVNEYLNQSLARLNELQSGLYMHINSQERLDPSLLPLTVGQANDVVELLGTPLKKKGKEQVNSDFALHGSKLEGTENIIPLALQSEFHHPLQYVNDVWNPMTEVPFYVPESIEDRQLPTQTTTYPYLTVSDLLEPTIIRLVYPINKEFYFDGNVSYADSKGYHKNYLLPLKDKFFELYDVEYLKGSTRTNEPHFEIKEMATNGSVIAILRLQINGGAHHICYQRKYFVSADDSVIEEPNEMENKGTLVETQFGLGVFPPLHIDVEGVENRYRVGLIDRDLGLKKGNSYELEFLDKNLVRIENTLKSQRSSKDSGNEVNSYYYVVKKRFDIIRVNNSFGSGVVLPLFKTYKGGTHEYSFAVDFGTTNTHIEFTRDGNPAKEFHIEDSEVQVAMFHDIDKSGIRFGESGAGAIHYTFLSEFVPIKIGETEQTQFPQRTALCDSKPANIEAANVLSEFNIPFYYGKQIYLTSHYSISLNLKWGNYTLETTGQKKLEMYLEQLIFMIRNKILLNGGAIEQTKIYWTFPSSMLPVRVNILNSKWQELTNKYLGDRVEVVQVSESLAPYYYYKKFHGVFSAMTIDIGGGTTDIAVFKEGKAKWLSSFKFGGNALFGDGYGLSPDRNGFVQKYHDLIVSKVKDSGSFETSGLDLLSNSLSRKRSGDIVSDYFELESFIEKVNFSKDLEQDEQLKICVLLFYSAIVYHATKLIILNNDQIPRHIAFSGTASKVLNILDTDSRFKTLTTFTKRLIGLIYGKEINQLDIEFHKNPKEVTAKGALLAEESRDDIREIKQFYIGDNSEKINPKAEFKYRNIDEHVKAGVMDEVRQFVQVFFAMDKNDYFFEYFGIHKDAVELAKGILLSNDMKRYLSQGLEKIKTDIGTEDETMVGETLFFYPLIGAINEIGFTVVQEDE